jgi:hypothetical protein
MRDLGLRAVQPRGYRRTTLPGDRPVDLLERAFAPDSCAPGERLVGDITYLRSGARHQRGHRVDHDDVDRAGPDQRVGDLQRRSPAASASVSTPSFRAYSGSSACSASMKAAIPPAR